MKIAIITYSKSSRSTARIITEGQKRGHEMMVLNPDKLVIFISTDRTSKDFLYKKVNGYLERVETESIDAIIPRVATNLKYASAIINHLNKNLGIFSLQKAQGIKIASNKLLTIQQCSLEKIPIPKTIYARDVSMIDFYLQMVGGTPVIVKTTSGSHGDGVLLLDSDRSAKSTIQALIKLKTNFIIQEFINSNGVDFRGIVVGNKVVASYKRQAVKGEFRANLHKGASAEAILLSKEDQAFCVKCAKALNLHTAGIDFIKDSNGNSLLIEVNSNFGFKIEKITGKNIAKEMILFLEEKIIKKRNKKAYYSFVNSVEFDHFENEME